MPSSRPSRPLPSLLPRTLFVTKPFLFTIVVFDARWQRRCCQVMHATKKKKKKKTRSSSRLDRTDRGASRHKQQQRFYLLWGGRRGTYTIHQGDPVGRQARVLTLATNNIRPALAVMRELQDTLEMESATNGEQTAS